MLTGRQGGLRHFDRGRESQTHEQNLRNCPLERGANFKPPASSVPAPPSAQAPPVVFDQFFQRQQGET
ncbi:hypothetical protein MPC4_70178 [Methylocella tundrae]|uniref:Uncharacterized protein n=1 Tax=Methylocella tundrae TaxID=227605 RepID=A0A8B6MBB9_METTU|nr:hypothetical protein MPC1_12800002 [Methylocella tundrae]VTZ52290.1 hypothetical protein MPC4_70178 [Methylocella tundrae]